jgi:hypothetical protein
MYGSLVMQRSATWLYGPEPRVRTELGTIIARSVRTRLLTAKSIDGGRALGRAAGSKLAALRIAAGQSCWLRRHSSLAMCRSAVLPLTAYHGWQHVEGAK